ncbi:Flagellar motor protein MotB [Candidatus Bealeia paramacronuclearis]|uniref:Flagellar motor protein MotB n=1 Tax=Candidatus Bealeia paramacronuclearis TaxID=1921001 RepID=A0ABZ2C3K5_9PROT|nr:Flagellar motor protein MotB [Candidatus Bealeia paramacronuclearis]
MAAQPKPSDQLQPIIVIKKIKKVAGHGHHGGAWKVAYADFVTAMMAFFLLMWLLNATSDEQKMGISNYFDPIGVSQGATGAGGVMGGKSIKSDGVLHDVTATPTVGPPLGADSEGDGESAGTYNKPADQLTVEEKKKLQKTVDDYEEKLFKAAEAELKKSIGNDPELKAFMDNLKIDRTPEGLRIQIVDANNQSMFPSGSSRMYSYMEKLLQKVALVVLRMPNKISVAGHTDAHQYALRNSYTNWELSSDRANASRRVLISTGLSPDRMASVVGKAETDPLIKDNPEDPANRRISITLLKKSISDPGLTEKPAAPVAAPKDTQVPAQATPSKKP